MSSYVTNTIQSIWYVDDDPDDHFIFHQALSFIAPQITLRSINSGDELLSALEQSQVPDLLFLDLHMPMKSGQDCIVQVRSTPGLHRLPIIAYSGSDGTMDVTHAYGIGADLYLRKPQSYDEFLLMMQKVLALDWKNPKQIAESHFRNGQYEPFT